MAMPSAVTRKLCRRSSRADSRASRTTLRAPQAQGSMPGSRGAPPESAATSPTQQTSHRLASAQLRHIDLDELSVVHVSSAQPSCAGPHSFLSTQVSAAASPLRTVAGDASPATLMLAAQTPCVGRTASYAPRRASSSAQRSLAAWRRSRSVDSARDSEDAVKRTTVSTGVAPPRPGVLRARPVSLPVHALGAGPQLGMAGGGIDRTGAWLTWLKVIAHCYLARCAAVSACRCSGGAKNWHASELMHIRTHTVASLQSAACAAHAASVLLSL